MLSGIIGLQNAGKTLLMTLFLFLDYLKGRKIYCNYHVSFPHTRINKESILAMAQDPDFDLQDCSIGIDEIWIFFDSRRAMSDDNLVLSWLLLQSSKSDTNIYGTAQRFGQFDKRFRDNLHKLIECERCVKYQGTVITLKPSLEVRDLSKIHPHMNEVLYILVKTYTRTRKGVDEHFKLQNKQTLSAKPVFQLFDSFEKKHISKD